MYLAHPKFYMEYRKLVAVTGLPGLYELVNSKSDGAIVRSLEDNSTKFVSSRVHQLSHLETTEVYTTGENVNLVEVFNAMKNSSENLPDAKDNKKLKKYFETVYPEMDFDRVYTSDMKKIVKWYEELQKHNVEIKLTEEEDDQNSESEVQSQEVQSQEAGVQNMESQVDEENSGG